MKTLAEAIVELRQRFREQEAELRKQFAEHEEKMVRLLEDTWGDPNAFGEAIRREYAKAQILAAGIDDKEPH